MYRVCGKCRPPSRRHIRHGSGEWTNNVWKSVGGLARCLTRRCAFASVISICVDIKMCTRLKQVYMVTRKNKRMEQACSQECERRYFLFLNESFVRDYCMQTCLERKKSIKQPVPQTEHVQTEACRHSTGLREKATISFGNR